MSNRFRFRGYAIGAAGEISQPFSEIIEVQAASALPQIGGFGAARSAGFRHREILQFDLAHTEVAAARCECRNEGDKPSYSSRMTSTVEGLNIMGMVTADRVVATIAAASDGEPSFRLLGTHFENLKIAGIPVAVDLALDVFDGLSLVRGLAPARGGLECRGHVIHVGGFGTVRLAEIEASQLSRTISMIQVDFDCPFKGRVMCGEVSTEARDVTGGPDPGN